VAQTFTPSFELRTVNSLRQPELSNSFPTCVLQLHSGQPSAASAGNGYHPGSPSRYSPGGSTCSHPPQSVLHIPTTSLSSSPGSDSTAPRHAQLCPQALGSQVRVRLTHDWTFSASLAVDPRWYPRTVPRTTRGEEIVVVDLDTAGTRLFNVENKQSLNVSPLFKKLRSINVRISNYLVTIQSTSKFFEKNKFPDDFAWL